MMRWPYWKWMKRDDVDEGIGILKSGHIRLIYIIIFSAWVRFVSDNSYPIILGFCSTAVAGSECNMMQPSSYDVGEHGKSQHGWSLYAFAYMNLLVLLLDCPWSHGILSGLAGVLDDDFLRSIVVHHLRCLRDGVGCSSTLPKSRGCWC